MYKTLENYEIKKKVDQTSDKNTFQVRDTKPLTNANNDASGFVIPRPRKKRKEKEGCLSKFVYVVNFIINISKGFLENKIETLTIYISLSY